MAQRQHLAGLLLVLVYVQSEQAFLRLVFHYDSVSLMGAILYDFYQVTREGKKRVLEVEVGRWP